MGCPDTLILGVSCPGLRVPTPLDGAPVLSGYRVETLSLGVCGRVGPKDLDGGAGKTDTGSVGRDGHL